MKARAGKQPIRVVIADDHPVIREGLTAILRSQNDIDLMSHHRAPKPRIIVMATYEDEEDIRRTLSAGAIGYILKAAPPRSIWQAVRAASGKDSRLSSGTRFETCLVASGR
jgi:DNA-binding NarL/FixJ family response regulator